MAKLNLASNDDLREGYVNLDGNKDLPGVLPGDVRNLPFKDNVFDEVLASHILEHIIPWELPTTVIEWRRVLKPGGFLHIIVPDMDVMCKEWLACGIEKQANWWNMAIFGSHRGPGQDHRSGLNRALLEDLLRRAGFRTLVFYYNDTHKFWLEVRAKK